MWCNNVGAGSKPALIIIHCLSSHLRKQNLYLSGIKKKICHWRIMNRAGLEPAPAIDISITKILFHEKCN